MAWDMYAKKIPLPGQLENCEICEKRFTVTAYSKTGEQGGLLCTKCSKEQMMKKKNEQKPKKETVSRDKRRQTQSNLLDGIVQNGSKSLLDLCIKVRNVSTCLWLLLISSYRLLRIISMILMSLAIFRNPYSIA